MIFTHIAVKSVCFAWAGCLAFSSIALAADHSFPFPVEVDAKAGKTGEYPHRVLDKRSGTWLVFVPGGKYNIGTDKRPDSKPIELTLSGFYISQAQVGGKPFAKGYEAEWEREVTSGIEDIMQDKEFYEETHLPKKLTPADIADLRLLFTCGFIQMRNLFSTSGWDISFESLGFDAREEKQLEKLVAGVEKRVDDGKPPVPLTQADRKVAKEIIAAYRRCFRKAGAEQKSAVRKVNYYGAQDYAESQGLSLPTEAQWEVAAKLTQGKQIKLEGMFDDILEWCSDHYAATYYHRKGDFHDPTGPNRGTLLALAVGIWRLATEGLFAPDRDLRVVRGRDISIRNFSLPANHRVDVANKKPKSDMGFRVVYNPKPVQRN